MDRRPLLSSAVHDDPALTWSAAQSGVSSYLVKGLPAARLICHVLLEA
jgi:hypothetical protein